MCHLATDEQIVWKVIRIPPERSSPELAVSVYPSYGPLIDAIFARDAPVAVSQGCVDNFVMAEVISFLTEPRGRRNDYHMRRDQWAW